MRNIVFIACLIGWFVGGQSALGATGGHDGRRYAQWSSAPYNKIVKVKDVDDGGLCTGQYVAENIILTARHCITDDENSDNRRNIGSKKLQIITHDNRKTNTTVIDYGDNFREEDWAFLLIENPDFYSADYFDLSKTKVNNKVIDNAGFGNMRILTDEEIQMLHNIWKDLKKQNAASLSEILTKISPQMEQANIEPLRDFDFRLKTHVDCNLLYNVSHWGRNNILSDCDTFPGNSGGAYFKDGVLYAIHSAASVEWTNDNFAFTMPSSVFNSALSKLRKQYPSQKNDKDVETTTSKNMNGKQDENTEQVTSINDSIIQQNKNQQGQKSQNQNQQGQKSQNQNQQGQKPLNQNQQVQKSQNQNQQVQKSQNQNQQEQKPQNQNQQGQKSQNQNQQGQKSQNQNQQEQKPQNQNQQGQKPQNQNQQEQKSQNQNQQGQKPLNQNQQGQKLQNQNQQVQKLQTQNQQVQKSQNQNQQEQKPQTQNQQEQKPQTQNQQGQSSTVQVSNTNVDVKSISNVSTLVPVNVGALSDNQEELTNSSKIQNKMQALDASVVSRIDDVENMSTSEFLNFLADTVEYQVLEQRYNEARAREQSTANKLLGAAGIGAGGIGGMMLASGMAEQNADADAETAMRAYLATFTCNYGAGKNVAGGTENVELPGGNELIGLYTEYVTLANDLKRRKEDLGMAPGIESEPILESATSGLYDDVATGKTSGAYASLARALMDPEGEDAKAWAAQKEESAKNVKTGAITAGVGVGGSLVGNMIVNRDKNKDE